MGYYLKDMQRAGFIFICNNVIQSKKKTQILSGSLIYGTKSYPAKVRTYFDGHVSKFIDACGNDPEEAQARLMEIVKIMERCYAHNVNGIRDIRRKRFFFYFIKFVCSLITGTSMLHAIGQLFLIGLSWKPIILTFLLMVCFFLSLKVNWRD